MKNPVPFKPIAITLSGNHNSQKIGKIELLILSIASEKIIFHHIYHIYILFIPLVYIFASN